MSRKKKRKNLGVEETSKPRLLQKMSDMRDLSEAELREQVIIPLLHALGYQGIEHTHGPNEQGKDIVFWKQDELGARQYVAVVAKKGKITGSAVKIGEITTQVKQALSDHFVDGSILEEHEIHKCWIVASGKITSAGPKSLRNSLKTDGLLGKVRVIPGNELWQLFLKHVPQKSLLGNVDRVSEALEQLLPDTDLIISASGDKRQFVHKGTKPISFQIGFPSPEGASKWDTFRRTGRQTTFSEDELKITGLPEPQMSLMGGDP